MDTALKNTRGIRVLEYQSASLHKPCSMVITWILGLLTLGGVLFIFFGPFLWDLQISTIVTSVLITMIAFVLWILALPVPIPEECRICRSDDCSVGSWERILENFDVVPVSNNVYIVYNKGESRFL